MKLTLGIVGDIPYPYGSGRRTTKDVAHILEDKYGVMRHFVTDNRAMINAAIVESLRLATASTLKGRPMAKHVFDPALRKIEKAFRQYILTRQMDGRVAGVPTAAALHGVNHRLRHPYARRASRPSFKDTGTYMRAMKAWIDP